MDDVVAVCFYLTRMYEEGLSDSTAFAASVELRWSRWGVPAKGPPLLAITADGGRCARTVSAATVDAPRRAASRPWSSGGAADVLVKGLFSALAAHALRAGNLNAGV